MALPQTSRQLRHVTLGPSINCVARRNTGCVRLTCAAAVLAPLHVTCDARPTFWCGESSGPEESRQHCSGECCPSATSECVHDYEHTGVLTTCCASVCRSHNIASIYGSRPRTAPRQDACRPDSSFISETESRSVRVWVEPRAGAELSSCVCVGNKCRLFEGFLPCKVSFVSCPAEHVRVRQSDEESQGTEGDLLHLCLMMTIDGR